MRLHELFYIPAETEGLKKQKTKKRELLTNSVQKVIKNIMGLLQSLLKPP